MDRLELDLDYYRLYLDPYLSNKEIYDNLIHMHYYFRMMNDTFQLLRNGRWMQYTLLGYRVSRRYVWSRGWES